MFKKVFSFILCLAVVASFSFVPASAVEVTGGQLNFGCSGTNGGAPYINWDLSIPSSGDKSQSSSTFSKSYSGIFPFSNARTGTGNLSGVVTMYFSFFFGTPAGVDRFHGSTLYPSPSDIIFKFNKEDGTVGTGHISATTFTPNFAGTYTTGYTLRGTIDTSELGGLSIQNPWFDFTTNAVYFPVVGSQTNCYVYPNVPSLRIVATETSADLDALENIANGIASQSAILQAMYGDIVALLNSIYSRCGDLLTAQNLTNQYFSQIIPVLNSIDGKTTDIYNLLSTQFSLLISTIERESDDIQKAIDDATIRLITYLDSAFSGAVGQLPGTTDGLNSAIQNNDNFESEWQSNVSQQWENLQVESFMFPNVYISGFSLVLSIFEDIWDSLGEYTSLYIFPLMLGVVLLLIGRISRMGGRERSHTKEDDNA